MDNRHLSPKELSVFKVKIVEAVEEGFSQAHVAKLFGFTPTTVSKYIRDYKKRGEESFGIVARGRKKGEKRKMSKLEEVETQETIDSKTPDEVGLECVLWTRKAVREYIDKKYKVKYAVRSMTDVLNRWGFTPQKPLKIAIQKDPIRVQKWLDEDYVQIKKQAIEEGASIFWGDEMGLSSTDQRGRTYGKKGCTPSIQKTGSRFRCNMIAAITNQGSMKWNVFKESFTTDLFIDFLRRLTYKSPKKVFLILDNHKVHHAKKVTAWVQKHSHKIQLFFLPPYSPELNPQELVNQEIKGHSSNFKLMTSMEALSINLRCYLTKIQFNRYKIKAYFQKDSVRYAS